MLFPVTITGCVRPFCDIVSLADFHLAQTMIVVPLKPDDIQYRRRVVA